MKDQNVKPMYVGVDEVCADWGCSRSKGYAIIKLLSEQMHKENPKLLVIAARSTGSITMKPAEGDDKHEVGTKKAPGQTGAGVHLA